MNRNIFIWFLVVLALLVIAGGTWWYLSMRVPVAPTSTSSRDNSPAAVLTNQNQDYLLAKNYQKQGKYDLALQYYQKALVGTQDPLQRAQLLYNVAYATELSGKYADAIAQYKAIAADTSNFPIARAASIQEIGLMYFMYYTNDAQQTILAETFKDPPYDSFKKTGGLNFAYTKLFEYAASIYPLAGSEVRIAYGSANELTDTLHGATTTSQGKAYLALIERSLRATDADLQRMSNVSAERNLIPEILVREGTTLDNLVSLGAADLQQVEPYFQKGAQYAASIGNRPGSFIELNYALFLTERYGDARSTDIINLLAPFKAGNEAKIYSTVIDFLKTVRTNSSLTKRKALLVKASQIDPNFKQYLISLGWKATDF